MKTRGGIPVESAAAPRLHARDFLVATHLGIVLEVYDADGVGIVTGRKAPVNRLAYAGAHRDAGGFVVPGYTAQVLLVDSGLRRPFQVIDGVIVTQPSPDTRIRPQPTTLEALDETARADLARGLLPFDWPIDRLNGDWCVVGYLGGSEQKPYVVAWWPSRRSTLAGSIGAPTTDAEPGGGAAFDAPVADPGSRAESVTVRAGVVTAVEPDGSHIVSTLHGGTQSGVRAAHTGGHMVRRLKPGAEYRVEFGRERGQAIVIRRGDRGPVLEIGLGAAGHDLLLLGRRFLRFFGEFRAAVLAKFSAIEERLRNQDRRHRTHQHHTAWGPTPGEPFSTPPLGPDEPTVFADDATLEDPPAAPGAKPAPAAVTPAGSTTTARSLPDPRPYDLLSGSIRVPDRDLLRFEPDEDGS